MEKRQLKAYSMFYLEEKKKGPVPSSFSPAEQLSYFFTAPARIDFKYATGLEFLFQYLGWLTPVNFFQDGLLPKHLNITSVLLLIYTCTEWEWGSHSQRRIRSENTCMCVLYMYLFTGISNIQHKQKYTCHLHKKNTGFPDDTFYVHCALALHS